jgi:hypothetical protein
MDDQTAFDHSLKALQSEATNFAQRFIQDSAVRVDYLKSVKRFSEEALAAVSGGEISACEAMLHTHAMRNELLSLARLMTSDIDLAQAQALKATGLPLETLMEKYAQKLFGKPFAELTEAQREDVYLAIVESATRANPKVILRAMRLAKVGKAFWVFTAAVAIYNIARTDDKVVATARAGATIGGGIAGGAAVDLICGPGAPVCVGIGGGGGVALGALGAQYEFDEIRKSGSTLEEDFERVLVPRIVSLDGHADIPLDRSMVVVGRHRQCDVRIASPLVSRRHCCLAVHHQRILVRDLRSTHGTRINGQRIEEGVLHPGDELAIADCRYRIELGLTEGTVPGPSTPSDQGV